MPLLIGVPLICFITSYITTSKWLVVCKDHKLVARDIHKRKDVIVPRIGGLPAALISTFVVFFVDFESILRELIAVISMIAILLGLLDDTISLRDLEKVLIPIAPFALLGTSLNTIDVLGFSFKGYLALALVALIGTYSVNATNTLAGFNGLEAGLSVIIGSFLSLLAFLKGFKMASLLLASFSACYLAFLLFNFYPAKAFPGNCSTFQMGAFLAAISIVLGLVTPFLIMMIPHALDFFLKLLCWRKMKEKRPTRIDENGFLTPPPHLSLIGLLLRTRKMRELELVLFIYFIEILLGLISLIVTLVYLP